MGKTTKKAVSICITSAKGGVGKTTTTLNLAGIYEVLEKKVLIIDLDVTNGGIALSLNKPYKKEVREAKCYQHFVPGKPEHCG